MTASQSMSRIPALLWVLLLWSSMSITIKAQQSQESISSTLPLIPPSADPKLSGHHFRITMLETVGYVDIHQDTNNGQRSPPQFSGYLMDILEELAQPHRANFTYELVTPSGFGSLCEPRLTIADHETGHHPDAYSPRYYGQFQCGESDVNDRPLSQYSTDLYWGVFYITPERLKANKFTIPYVPPAETTLAMMGTATHIHSIPDLAHGNYAVCAFEGTAYKATLEQSFPQLQIKGIAFDADLHAMLNDGTCDVIIETYPKLRQIVLELYQNDQCQANGKPIGIIGEPLEYGLNHFAFGVRNDLPDKVVEKLNFWLQALMACFPQDDDGYCPNGNGSISQFYNLHGGTGKECGYVQFPDDDKLPVAAIVAIALTPVVLVVIVGYFWHARMLKRQEKRMKKRFIQQLARNIDIGPSAGLISVEKLSNTFSHIGGKDGLISKQDLAKWMNDLNLDFLSEKDFDRLWETMDIDGSGYVDPIEFCDFLRECEKQFQEVHQEYSSLPKTEKVKLAARRLTNIESMGEEEVAKMERRNNRRSRQGGPGFNPLAKSAPESAGGFSVPSSAL